jgi:hypothetical protein
MAVGWWQSKIFALFPDKPSTEETAKIVRIHADHR